MTNPPRRLPELSLPRESSGAATPISAAGRDASIVVFVHGIECEPCARYLRLLAAEKEAIREWDAKVVAVRVGEAVGANGVEAAAFEFPILADPAGTLAASLTLEVPAIVIADQWGEIHAAEVAGADHDFIAPAEVAEWAKFLAIQCPECQGEAL